MSSNDRNYSKLITMIGLFLISSSLFIYEVLTTRLFSTVLVYHFVFLVTSLAILGLGIGGIIVFFFEKKLRIFKMRTKAIAFFSIILSISYLVITLSIYKLPYIDVFIIYSVMACIPFVFGGIILSLIFIEFKNIGHKLYFADLLGSSIGSISIIFFMNSTGFIGTLIITSMITILSALLFSLNTSGRKVKIVSSILAVLFIVVFMNNTFVKDLEKKFTAYVTSPHTVINYWNERIEGKVEIEYTKWDSISRTDVIDVGVPNKKTIITDGGASAPMIRFDGDLNEVLYLKDSIEYIPFEISSNDSTLLIGSGGGEDVLLALLGDANDIDAVEINPSTIDAVNEFREFNGGIYNLEGVSLYIQDGRKFISITDKKYDHIYLGKVFSGVVDNSAAMLSENYIYTEEAYNEYLNHLNDDGILTFVFNDVREMIKSINTMTKILIERGVNREDVTKYFIAVNTLSEEESQKNNSSIWMPVVIYRETPFSNDEIASVKAIAEKQNRAVINLPNYHEIPLYKIYAEGKITFEELVDRFQFNAKPTIDNRPFFYDYDKGIPDTLLYMLLGVLFIGILLFIVVFNNKELRSISVYFSIIGLGFMLVEIPIMQKAILFMGSTTKAFSFILFSLLFSSGIGSFISSNGLIERINKKRDYIFLIVGLVNLLIAIVSPVIFNSFVGIDIIGKFFVVFLLLFPLGIFLGMPFPRGIKRISQGKTVNGIPLAWGINGIMSVVSSILSLIISMKLGFNITLILGTLFYLILFVKNPLRA